MNYQYWHQFLIRDNEKELLRCIKERCYQEGDFTLSSGRASNYYLDLKQVTLDPCISSLIGYLLYQRSEDLDIGFLGGPEVGAISLVTATIPYFMDDQDRYVGGFFTRNHPKDHGTRQWIEGNLQPGSSVVLVDDVVTSGESLLRSVNIVRDYNCQVLRILVLVDRLEGARELFEKAGIPFASIFTIEDLRTKTGSP